MSACATTVDKAQGAEYHAAVVTAMTRADAMPARNLLYTGVTRGKCLVVLFGQRKAIAMAVRNGGQRRRWSKPGRWFAPRHIRSRLGRSLPSFRGSAPVSCR